MKTSRANQQYIWFRLSRCILTNKQQLCYLWCDNVHKSNHSECHGQRFTFVLILLELAISRVDTRWSECAVHQPSRVYITIKCFANVKVQGDHKRRTKSSNLQTGHQMELVCGVPAEPSLHHNKMFCKCEGRRNKLKGLEVAKLWNIWTISFQNAWWHLMLCDHAWWFEIV